MNKLGSEQQTRVDKSILSTKTKTRQFLSILTHKQAKATRLKTLLLHKK